MSSLRITRPPSIDWTLARHITSPEQQGSCIGLPRKHAPPPEDLSELERTHYRGVKRRVMADRTKYEVYATHGGKTRYVGVANTAVEAARLYDAYCVAWGLEKPLNFPAEQEQSA